MRFHRVALAFSLLATSASAQSIDAAARKSVVDSLAATLVRLYVDADTGRLIADRLHTRLSSGAYDKLDDPRRFADVLTSDLQSINGDGHLNAAFTGANSASGGPQPRPRGQNPAQAEAARRDHWGLGRVEILTGNVGYMKVNSFEGSPAALEATSAALKYLEGTDAMIFDFRGMGGGSGEQSNFLLSHFTGPDTVPSLVVANRARGTRQTRYTLASVPGMRRPTVPIWILTDRGTASAGEDFSFVLQQLGRARVVGDRTAGAGHNNTFVPLGNGFTSSISYTRVSDAKTGREWERVGVAPDVKVAPREALAAAHTAALEAIASTESDAARRQVLASMREGVVAGARPHVVDVATLQSYAGAYEGGRLISVENGALVYRRSAARPPRTLVATSDAAFLLDGAVPISFEKSASGMQMVQRLPDGSRQSLSRIGPVEGDLAP